MIQRIQKWFAIRNYAKKLGPNLRQRYGASRYYSPGQVRATIKKSGLSLDWWCYAFCMYCDFDSFTQYHADIGEVCDYGAMQSEVLSLLSVANTAFDSADISAMIEETVNWSDSSSDGVSGIDGENF